jgi:hypothetical protein
MTDLEQRIVDQYLRFSYPDEPGTSLEDAAQQALVGTLPQDTTNMTAKQFGNMLIDVPAALLKGGVQGTIGLPGDLISLGKGIAAAIRPNAGEGRVDAFLRGMEGKTLFPTTEDVRDFLDRTLGPVVPESETDEARRKAAAVPEFIGELGGGGKTMVEGAKAAAKTAAAGAKFAAPKVGEMLDNYMGRMGLRLFAAPEDYRGSHRAPMRSDDVSAPGFDMTTIMPDDIYSAKAAHLYGHTGGNDPMDKNSVRLIKMMRGKPEMDVMIFRAVPKDVEKAEINRGDWVTINKDYAVSHGESVLGGEYKILSKMVKAKDIHTDGNSIHEWGYDPAVKE